MESAEQSGKEGADAAEAPAAENQDAWDDADYEYFFGDYLDEGYRSRTPSEYKELPPIENTLSTTTSLSDHLLWQLRMQDDERTYDIGTAIVGNLDEDGRLAASVEEIAAWEAGTTCDASGAIEAVQTLDPVGVARQPVPRSACCSNYGTGGAQTQRGETASRFFAISSAVRDV